MSTCHSVPSRKPDPASRGATARRRRPFLVKCDAFFDEPLLTLDPAEQDLDAGLAVGVIDELNGAFELSARKISVAPEEHDASRTDFPVDPKTDGPFIDASAFGLGDCKLLGGDFERECRRACSAAKRA